MGGNGGSDATFEIARLKRMAEERLETLLAQSAKILFACEATDRRSLDSHLARSRAIQTDKRVVIDSSQSDQITTALTSASIVVLFTNETASTAFLDTLIDEALVHKKTGFHVKAHPNAVAPNKAIAYRWRSVSWEQLESFFE